MKKAQRILAALIALPLLLTVLTGCELIGALEIKMGLHEHKEFVDGDYRCCCLSKTFNVVGCLIVEYVGEDKEEIVIPKTIGGHPVMIIGRIGALDLIFSNCSSLKSVTIPETITFITGAVFSGCNSLIELNVDENNKTYHSDDNCIIETATNTLVAGCAASVIPDYVTAIGSYAFHDYTSLTTITIPDSVTSIDVSAFERCTSLTSVTIPDGVISIADYAFNGCTSLTSVTIPDSVTSIDASAFSGCTSLTELNVDENNEIYHSDGNCIIETATDTLVVGCASSVIPDYVKAIGRHAFSGRKSLTSMTIPDSVTSIDDFAFNGCTSLTSVTIPDSVTSIGYYAFSNCTSLTSIIIPDTVTYIGGSAFEACTVLSSLTIGSSVTEIHWSLFRGCDSLTELKVDESNARYHSDGNCIIETATNTLVAGCGASTIPDYVTEIGYSAFNGCTALTSITIPDSVTSISMSAFDECTSLISVTIGSGVTEIGASSVFGDEDYHSVFSGCNSLIELNVDENNKTYHSDDNCIIETATNTLVVGCAASAIPDYITEIGEDAFYDCTSLTSISIPDSVTKIESCAFYYCESLAEINYSGTMEQWGTICIGFEPFYGVKAKVVYCADGDVDIPKY